MPLLVNDSEKVTSPNNAWVLSVEEGLHYLQQLKELGKELDENGNLKQSLDIAVAAKLPGGLPDDIDGVINSLNRLIEEGEKIGDEQISKDKLDELLAEYDKALREGVDSEAALKEIFNRNPNLGKENIDRFVEVQKKFRDEIAKAEVLDVETKTVEEGVVVDEEVKNDVKLVKGKIQDLSRRVAQETGVSEVDKETLNRIETEMEKLIAPDVRSGEEKINDLARAVARGEISQLEYKVKIEEMEKWALEHRKEVDNYLTEKFVEGVNNENGGKITDEQRQAARTIKNLSNNVFHGGDEIKTQEDLILKNDSSGKTIIGLKNLEATVGFGKMSLEETNNTLEKVREAELKLGSLKIPSDYEVEAFGRVSAVLRKDEKTRNALERIQKKRTIFGKKVNFYQFTNGQKRIWKEQVLMGNNLNLEDAMRRTYRGIERGSFGGTPMATNGVAVNLNRGFLGGLQKAVSGSFLKKSLGDLGSKLGPGIRNVLGNGINTLGKGLFKGINSFGGVLSSIGRFKVKVMTTALAKILIVGGIVLILFYAITTIMGSGWNWDENATEEMTKVYPDGGSGAGREF